MSLLLTILALGAVVALHEAGHMGVARLFGMRVDRFSIGLGPVVLRFQKGATEYVLSALPFGGYVAIAGMNPQDDTHPEDPESYANKPVWQRFLVILAGPVTNYALCFLLLANLNIFGMPKATATPTFGEIVPNSAAAAAGILKDDTLVSINAQPIAKFEEMRAQIQKSQGQALVFHVQRGQKELDLSVVPRARGNGFEIGVYPKTELERMPIGQGIWHAAVATYLFNGVVLQGLYMAVTGAPGVELGGTVEVVAQTRQAAEAGAATFFLSLASINIMLALFNLLPLPALDGGRLAFLLVEMVRRKPANPQVETFVHGMGMLALLSMMIYLTVGDVRKRLSPADVTPSAALVDGGR
jgi:regulator of sigma E protease